MITKTLRRAALVASVVAVAGCSEMLDDTSSKYPPKVIPVTQQNLDLRLLPAPKSRVTVSVYDMPDLTGQFRERENVQSLSRAVSQGGGALLTTALQDAGQGRWFTVLDRTNLDNLLRERQIATEMRRLYRGEDTPNPSAVPPLRHSGIIIQGAVVGYDANVQTGGFGARYLGIGGDTQWKLDIVTVALQAVAMSTGELLASVMVEKPIASTSVRGGTFTFIELDKLLEIETGVAANEPKQLAVQMATEKAVRSLIIKGAEVGVWSFADHRAQQSLIAAHRAEKYGETQIPEAAKALARPDTRNATHVVATRPVARPRPASSAPVRERIMSPATESDGQSDTRPPPPPAEDEVIG
ncbi:curli production assembly/transport component CsgG [Salinihabitans flavidus]|uniref:Curli production assembly/transport component CsgG n=1 Tax=Salinihabitans flavidus TaxID=569882 RepID=A0A1H8VFP4_9RHOB|nr:CsgG/HfaB family protein [Salinihabitans flavidus]SEP13688.1 curli production assembly/transport component CsgG [Salinihabitans flavidus]